MQDRTITALALVGVAAYTVAASTTVSATHDWGGDFSMYVAHAKNLASTVPYSETGYLYNPAASAVGPPSYPPGTAWLLAPVYARWGLDLVALKVALTLTFGAALAVIFSYFRLLAGPGLALVVVTAVAANPYVWHVRERILSEYPFMLWLYLALLLLKLRDRQPSAKRRLAFALFAGAAAYLAFSTRTVGLLLIPALVVHDLFRRRHLLVGLLPAVTAFVVPAAWQVYWLSRGVGYHDSVSFSIGQFPRNVRTYFDVVLERSFLLPDAIRPLVGRLAPHLLVLTVGVAVALAAYAATRYMRRHGWSDSAAAALEMMRNLQVHDWFMGAYATAILFLPFFQGFRYLLPLLPLLVFYGLRVGVLVMRSLGLYRPRWVRVVFAVAVAYHAFYYLYGMPTGGDVGIHARESVQLFETVRRDLPQDAVLAFARPRVIALFGERKATIWPAEGGAEKAWDYFDDVGVTHLVIARPESGLEYPEFLQFYDRPPPPFLEPLYANDHFTIYRYQ